MCRAARFVSGIFEVPEQSGYRQLRIVSQNPVFRALQEANDYFRIADNTETSGVDFEE